ncbi:MFS transporter [Micromonospora sp. WMMD882]|uniref:MFS transporter n=1 Tax=Micromonospora sp. WMMD882 TaxID=3015151 RepID=UPI00248C67E3|nr:MFS transporter [Micromonospora sp. WMMD882]WBB80905.1 MFS transporter [Micromonospora sp. WMMD882]
MTPRARLATLVAADIVSTLGSRVSIVAIPWLVLETTGSPAMMGLVAAAETIPYLLSSALAAPLADRVGLRRTSVVADVGSAAGMLAVALAPWLGLPALVVLVAVVGGLRGIGDRVKHAMMRPAAEAAGVRLIRLTSVYEGLNRVVTLLGASLGGLLILWFGVTTALLIDAVSFAGCALLVGLFVALPTVAPADGDPTDAREGYWTALRGGFRYVRADRLLRDMLVVVFALNLVTNASIAVFVPLWVDQVLRSPAGLSLVLGAFGGGALLGSLVFTWLGSRLPPFATFVAGAALCGTPRLFALAATDDLGTVTAVTFVSAIGVGAINPLLGVALYERVPQALQTRVIGIAGAVGFAGLPAGALLAGWGVALFGLTPALLLLAFACLVVTAVPLVGTGRSARARPDLPPSAAQPGGTAPPRRGRSVAADRHGRV